jgi:putative nucleotidyltransferase with HDIG domain
VELLALSNPGVSAAELQDQIERLNRLIARSGKGLSGWVIKHGKSIRCPDVSADKRYSAAYEGIHSGVYVPIQIGERTIGSIAVESEQLDAFSDEDERLLKTLAAQSAIAFENARHYQEVVHASDRRTILHRASREVVAAGLDLEAVYLSINRAATELMKADVFTLALFDQAAREVEAVFLMDSGERYPGLRLPLGKGLSSWVIENRRSLRLRDYLKEKPVEFVPFGRRRTSRSVLAVPMVSAGSVVGAISVQAYQPGHYDEEDESLLEMLAAYAGTAIENARLFDEIQKRLRNLSALHAIDTAIGASVDLRMTLSILLEHTAAELKIDAAAVLVLNPASRLLEYTATHGFKTRVAEDTRLKMGESLAGQAAIRREFQGVANLRSDGHPPEDQASMQAVYRQEGFVAHYAIPLVAKGQVQGVLEAFHRSPFQANDDWIRFFDMLAGQAAIAIDNVRLFDDLQRSNLNLTFAYDATIQGWSQALELRDRDTKGHTQRVTDLTVQLAQHMGVPESEMEHVRRGALLHDIGKMATPDAILHKPDELNAEEWEIMRQHPVHAHEMLSKVAYLRPALDIPHYHHEKWDGSGYPEGLKGEQIPLPARIFAVVDVWDALTSDRPYRSAWTDEEAMAYIKVQSGKHFDPKVVDAFFALRAMEMDLKEREAGQSKED